MSDISKQVDELKAITKECDHYNIPSGEVKVRCREIGEELNKIGGMPAMTEAYYQVHDDNRYASILQAYWDGVGDWSW